MTVPNRSVTVRNGGNGVAMAGEMVRATVGVASAGTTKTVYSYTSPADLIDVHGYGPGVDAGSHDLQSGGGTMLFVRCKSTVAGSITTGVPDQGSDGTVVLSGTPNNRYRVAVEILADGDLGTGVFRYALDAGPDDTDEENRNWSLPVAVPSGGTYVVPNTGLTLTFANGAGPGDSFEAGDVFPFSTSAPSYVLADLQDALGALRTHTDAPLWIHVVGETTAAIAAGVKTWVEALPAARHAFVILDGEDVDPVGTVTKEGTTPPTLAVTGIPNESWDVVVTIDTLGALGTMKFKYSLDGGDTFSAAITSTAVTGINPIAGTGMLFTFAAGTYALDNVYTFSTWDKETNRAAWAAALISDFAAVASDRLVISAGFGECSLPTGKVARVPISWGFSPLLATIAASDDAGQAEDAGTIPGFLTISHDEEAHPGLDNAGFLTARKWDGGAGDIKGIYVNQPRIMSSAGSDYDLVQYRRVMDNACRALDAALVRKVNKKVRVNATTGFIDERDARNFDRAFQTAVEDVTTKKGDASEVTTRTRRNENLLSTRLLTVDLDVVGLAYIKTLSASIGYKNPALVPVA